MPTGVRHLLRSRELLVFASAYVVYNAARGAAMGGAGGAEGHARWILRLEHRLGIDVEAGVQHALGTAWTGVLLSYVYLAAQFVVLPAALVWLLRNAPAIYRLLRNAIIATWALAVPVYVVFPVTPPRLAGIGVSDVVSRQAAVSLTGRSTMFYNQLAAVPSLHVGFAVAVGVALAVALSRPAARFAAALWGPLVAVTVVATGNHYVFDIAAGLAATSAGFLVGNLGEVARRHRGPSSSSRRAWSSGGTSRPRAKPSRQLG